MFLRRYQRTKDGKKHAYFALVESQRTERGPRQRIVAQLGELTEDQERRLQRTAVFHSRHEDGEERLLFLDAREASPSHYFRLPSAKYAGWNPVLEPPVQAQRVFLLVFSFFFPSKIARRCFHGREPRSTQRKSGSRVRNPG